jgi:hypothetical protein
MNALVYGIRAVGEHQGERRSLPLVGLATRARFEGTQEEVDG